MIPVLDFREALVGRLPELRLEHLKSISRKLAEPRQRFLTHVLTNSFERRYPHDDDSSADAFSRDFLASGLHTRTRYSQFLEPFYDFPDGPWGYSKPGHTTKPYRLRKRARRALWEVYESGDPLPFEWLDQSGSVTTGPTPTNGVPPSAARYFEVPALLPIRMSAVEHAIKRIEGWIEARLIYPEDPVNPKKPRGTTWSAARQILYSAKKQIATLGGLPNLYAEQSTGRLGPSSGAFHLIRVPNALRHLLYEGSGMQDYDIRSCFYSLFLSLGREVGFATDRVESYVGNKKDWHARWAHFTGVAPDHFKGIAISWLTGGTMSPHGATAGARSIGPEGIRSLATDEFTRPLYDQVRHGMATVRAECGTRMPDGKDTMLVNAVGAELRLRHGKRRPGAEAMHLLAGLEQFAIREACSRVPSLQAVIYDGFIAPPVPVGPLEEAIRERSREELGITLDLELKQEDLSEPLADPEPDPWDF